MRVICAGGGTAGHINPALAIASEIAGRQPESKFLFIGTKKGMETTLVPKAGYDIQYIDTEGFSRSLTPSNIKVIIKAGLSVFKAKKIIKTFKPDIVIGTGGYVSGPVLFAASMLKIPTLIHEQNVFAGMTSRMLSGRVDTTCISFAESEKSFPKAKKIVLTGNPVRSALFKTDKKSARRALGIDQKPFIVSFGGSLGAKTINNACVRFIKSGAAGCNMLFATGTANYDEVMKELGTVPDNVKVVPYIYDMENVINAADLLICRAGAITVSEITALGKASVLIPSPNVTDNHQYYNAKAVADANAAVLITEQQLAENPDALNKKTAELISDRAALCEMERNSEKCGIKDGCDRIYNEVIKLVRR